MSILCQNHERVTRNPQPATWLCLDLETIDYTQALTLQHRLVAARKAELLDADVLLILEHRPVFTLGRRGGRENLRVTEQFLEKSGVQVVQAERGGNITYHGPGQLVVYLIFDLRSARIGVADFVDRLEEIMIRIADDWGVSAKRDDANRGIWVGRSKMGSVGIAIRRGISFHGLALNVDLSLDPFSWINPCGLENVGMTSLKQEADKPVAMPAVREAFKRHFATVFNAELVPVKREQIEKMIENGNLELDIRN